MRLARVLGFIGRLFIWVGSLILLFVAYQLWGTNIAEARAQDDLENEFSSRLGDLGLDLVLENDLATSPPTTPSTPTTTMAPLPPPDDGEAVARLVIPRIGVEKIVVEGVRRGDLQKGPGHYPGTPFPGQPGNSAIAGHRTTYGQPFHRIDELEPGDEILVATLQGLFRYEVTDTQIVAPSEVTVIDDQGDNRLTLTSCHPKYSARQRIVVIAVLVDDPAPPTVEPDPEVAPELASDQVLTDSTSSTYIAELDSLDAGEVRDSGAAVRWGAVLLAVWVALWALSKRWRKWPTIAIGVLPFVIVMIVFFDATTKALPANY